MWLAVLVISIIGTLFHFIYEWSNHNKIIALFAAVNESTWEHIKIALTPTFLWSLYDGFIYGTNPNYFVGKFICLLFIIVLIPTIFYLYKKIVKKPILFIDISSFYITIILSQMIFYHFLNINELNYIIRYISIIGTFLIFGFYMIATLQPLKNFIFKDPITNKYGIKGHYEEKIKK